MLKLSTRGRYATRILACMAAKNTSTPVRRKEIADSEGISIDYVEQILTQLRSSGLVRSHRGVKGGYTLNMVPGDITVAAVLEATEGSISLVPDCDNGCNRTSVCVTRAVWKKADEVLSAHLESVNIAGLAAEALELHAKHPVDFSI